MPKNVVVSWKQHLFMSNEIIILEIIYYRSLSFLDSLESKLLDCHLFFGQKIVMNRRNQLHLNYFLLHIHQLLKNVASGASQHVLFYCQLHSIICDINTSPTNVCVNWLIIIFISIHYDLWSTILMKITFLIVFLRLFQLLLNPDVVVFTTWLIWLLMKQVISIYK